MSRPRIGRLSLFLMSLFGLMSLLSASAFAAGAPTGVYAGLTETGWGINHAEANSTANPNGASTTVTTEYRESITAEFKSAGSVNIGSGTKGVSTYKVINGLKPFSGVQVRTKASNSFGTVYSTVYSTGTSRWKLEKVSEKHVAPFESTGSATFEWKMGGVDVKIACSESGSGTFGGESGTGTGYNANLSNCTAYENEKEVCKASASPSISVDQAFAPKSELVGFTFPECFYYEVKMGTSEPLFVNMPGFYGAYKTSQPLTLTGQFKWTSYTVNVTIATTWSLAGEDAGKKFTAFPFE